VYFCHAYASWEKGSVENLNGRIRRVIPKGTSIQRLSDTQVAAVEEWLNTTPRKCLGYRTPVEVMLEALGTAARLAA
jgi:transposase, IS30 family